MPADKKHDSRIVDLEVQSFWIDEPGKRSGKSLDILWHSSIIFYLIQEREIRAEAGKKLLDNLLSHPSVLAELELQDRIRELSERVMAFQPGVQALQPADFLVILLERGRDFGVAQDSASLLASLSLLLASGSDLSSREIALRHAQDFVQKSQKMVNLVGEGAGKSFADIKTDDKVIFLTFDAHAGFGREIDGAWELLETLRKHNIKATLFLTALFVEMAPDLVKQAIADGHEIGSHLKTHTPPAVLKKQKKFNKKWFVDELTATEKALAKISDKKMPKFFRLPYGIGDYRVLGPDAAQQILEWSRELGYTHFNWSLDALDWVKKDQKPAGFPYLTADKISSRIMKYAEDKPTAPIVLAHLVRYRDAEEDGPKEMVEALVGRARAGGYEFARLGEYVR
jgi:peptidoglycan/xylan/chitin deacetylase (PgdA/CDA1 family)